MKFIVVSVFLLGLGIWGAACAPSLPYPTGNSLGRVSGEWPETTLNSLMQGRRDYVGHCAACHTLHLPSEFSPDQWNQIVEKMRWRAKIDEDTRDSILKFLSAVTTKQNKANPAS